MGILAALINKVADFINNIQVPSFNFPTQNWSRWSGAISDCLYTANIIFPIDQILIVFGILVTFAFCMVSFYWIQRAINLLRGSG